MEWQNGRVGLCRDLFDIIQGTRRRSYDEEGHDEIYYRRLIEWAIEREKEKKEQFEAKKGQIQRRQRWEARAMRRLADPRLR